MSDITMMFIATLVIGLMVVGAIVFIEYDSCRWLP